MLDGPDKAASFRVEQDAVSRRVEKGAADLGHESHGVLAGSKSQERRTLVRTQLLSSREGEGGAMSAAASCEGRTRIAEDSGKPVKTGEWTEARPVRWIVML